jgi:anti-sigma factor RsiW
MGHEKENLSGYMDGAAEGAERVRIEAHLKDCASCRAELDALRAVSDMVRGLPQKPLPPGFSQRLEDRRRQEDNSGGWAALLSPRNAAWAACAVTVVFVTYKTADLRSPQRPQNAFSGAPALPAEALPHDLVSTDDLVIMAKQQDRAQGIAALRGASEAVSIPASGLAAPTAPRSFGGAAIGSAPEAKPAYTNEALQKHLEAERSRMGIQRIIAPNPVVSSLRAAARGIAADMGRSLDQEPVPAPLGGKTTTLLSRQQGPSPRSAGGALVPPEDFSGGAASGGSSLRTVHRQALGGAPLPTAATAEEAGRAVYSMEETTLLWREQGLPGSEPRVDFSREMLVVVLGQARIESVATATDRIVVLYRSLDSAPRPQERWRVIPRSELPVVFQPAPQL